MTYTVGPQQYYLSVISCLLLGYKSGFAAGGWGLSFFEPILYSSLAALQDHVLTFETRVFFTFDRFCDQVRLARSGPVVLPVQERGSGRTGQPVGRAAGRVLGRGVGSAAGRREAADRRPAEPRAPVPRALRVRAPVVRRAQHDQRRPGRAGVGRRRPGGSGRTGHGRGPAGGPVGRGRGQDRQYPVRHDPAHHRPRVRGTVRVREQDPRLTGRRPL